MASETFQKNLKTVFPDIFSLSDALMKRSRPGDEAPTTEDIVKRALQDEQHERHQKLHSKGLEFSERGSRGDPPENEFLSDSDVDDPNTDFGPSARDADGDIDDTETERRTRETERQALRDVEAATREHEEEGEEEGLEERRQLEMDHGYRIEAFHMREEREMGDIDGEGNLRIGKKAGDIEGGSDEDGMDGLGVDGGDGWLDGKQDQFVVDAVTREKIEARRREAERGEEKVVSAAEVARWQHRLYKILKEGETVAGALKRLSGGGGGGGGKKFLSAAAKKRLAKQAERQREKKCGSIEFDTEGFEEVTSCATLLMESGDVDVYVRDREYFKRAAALYIDVSDDDEGGDDDMFA